MNPDGPTVQHIPRWRPRNPDHFMREQRFVVPRRHRGPAAKAARRLFRRARFCCAVCLLAGGAFLVARATNASGQNAVGNASPSSSEADRSRDARLTLRARQALQQDPGLAALPLVGVSVRANAATLWGSVPAAELARRAETIVRQVPGIFEVRNDLRVEAANDPLVEFLKTTPPRPRTTIPEVAWLANRPTAILTGRPDEPTPTPAPSANGVALLPPITLDSPRPAATTVPELIGAIDRLQKADVRFQQVQIDVQGGLVRLGGTVNRWEEMFELAQAIARLPGVERVILQDVRTPKDRRR
jgi:osmotically-inducible protein OsmY